ncbi:putative fimbrial chaperone [Shigella sonnei]|uniref:fimbrial biogenesis chaperone n=1 Tax=Shigella sonnei TaxID=624 RepID=UPI000DA4E11F|nr:fimbria/pilus periplasmic chaperone [Shigella sonnei]SRW60068.1 putative fimbrial chaperone [Shigella sonnei]
MRYLNTKNLIAAGVLLACMSSIAWGAIIPDRTRIIMNESDKGEALKLTNQSKNLPYLAQTWIEDTKGNKSRDFIVTVPPMVRLNPSEQIQIRMISQEKIAQLPKEGANKQVISSQADSLIKISRIWADFFPVNTSNQPI